MFKFARELVDAFTPAEFQTKTHGEVFVEHMRHVFAYYSNIRSKRETNNTVNVISNTNIQFHLDSIVHFLNSSDENLDFLLHHDFLDFIVHESIADNPFGMRQVTISFFTKLLREQPEMLPESKFLGPFFALLTTASGATRKPSSTPSYVQVDMTAVINMEFVELAKLLHETFAILYGKPELLELFHTTTLLKPSKKENFSSASQIMDNATMELFSKGGASDDDEDVEFFIQDEEEEPVARDVFMIFEYVLKAFEVIPSKKEVQELLLLCLKLANKPDLEQVVVGKKYRQSVLNSSLAYEISSRFQSIYNMESNKVVTTCLPTENSSQTDGPHSESKTSSEKNNPSKLRRNAMRAALQQVTTADYQSKLPQLKKLWEFLVEVAEVGFTEFNNLLYKAMSEFFYMVYKDLCNTQQPKKQIKSVEILIELSTTLYSKNSTSLITQFIMSKMPQSNARSILDEITDIAFSNRCHEVSLPSLRLLYGLLSTYDEGLYNSIRPRNFSQRDLKNIVNTLLSLLHKDGTGKDEIDQEDEDSFDPYFHEAYEIVDLSRRQPIKFYDNQDSTSDDLDNNMQGTTSGHSSSIGRNTPCYGALVASLVSGLRQLSSRDMNWAILLVSCISKIAAVQNDGIDFALFNSDCDLLVTLKDVLEDLNIKGEKISHFKEKVESVLSGRDVMDFQPLAATNMLPPPPTTSNVTTTNVNDQQEIFEHTTESPQQELLDLLSSSNKNLNQSSSTAVIPEKHDSKIELLEDMLTCHIDTNQNNIVNSYVIVGEFCKELAAILLVKSSS